MSRSKAVCGQALSAVFALTACAVFGTFHLSASNLDIGPDPAMPGDTVMASFSVRLAPIQRHTIVLMIDDREHLRATSTEAPPLVSIITLGDAAALIAEYGTGTHAARIEVRAEEEGRIARTQRVPFELRDSVP